MKDFTAGLLFGATVSALLTAALCTTLWQRSAVAHGAARYNPTTAQFEWIETELEASGSQPSR